MCTQKNLSAAKVIQNILYRYKIYLLSRPIKPKNWYDVQNIWYFFLQKNLDFAPSDFSETNMYVISIYLKLFEISCFPHDE